jgi:hypothetical protein
MFYYLISKLPIFHGNNRRFKIFVLGTIFYIIAHAYLHSKLNESNIFISKYRNYLYYLFGIDCVLTFVVSKEPEEIQEEEEEDNQTGRSNAIVYRQNKNDQQQNNQLQRQQEQREKEAADERAEEEAEKNRGEILRMMADVRKSQNVNVQQNNDDNENEETLHSEEEDKQSHSRHSVSQNQQSIAIYQTKPKQIVTTNVRQKDSISQYSIPIYVSKN